MRWRFVAIISIAVVVVVIAIFGTMEYTSRPAFCSSCHEMKPMYNTWASSAHRNVSCIKCHAEPGLFGYIGTKLSSSKDLYYHITGTYKKPIRVLNSKVGFNKRCLVCHKNQIGKNDAHNKTHFNSGLACTECHEGLVHDAKKNKKPPTTAICQKCHG